MSLRFLSLLAAMLLFIPGLAFTAPSYAGIDAVVPTVAVASLDTQADAVATPEIIPALHIYDKQAVDVNTASGNDSGASYTRYRLALYQHVHDVSCRHVSRDTPHLYIE